MLVRDKVAIVTGAGRGVGQAIAEALAQEGAKVVVVARTAGEIEETARRLRSAGGVAEAAAGDVTDESQMSDVVRRTLEQFGRLDILVNNAGIFPPAGPLVEMPLEDFYKAIDVDLKGTFLCTKAVLPHMLERRSGRIVIVSAASAKRASPFAIAYAVAKAAQLAFTRCLAAEVGHYGITVNAICPLLLGTKMTQDFFAQVGARLGVSEQEATEGIMRQVLIGRSPTASEIGAFVAFLCSDEAGALTGQTFNLDGGWMLY